MARLGLASQALFVTLIRLSILAPPAPNWTQQTAYETILSHGLQVVLASLVAYLASQLLDIMLYQRIKQWSQGRWLWLRSNGSTIIGQAVDSMLFINIIFYVLPHKTPLILGSLAIKFLISILMTPVVYAIVLGFHHYLDRQTLAFGKR